MKLLLFFLLPLGGCSRDDCKTIAVTFDGRVLMNKDAVVIIDGGIAGHVEEVNFEGDVTQMKLCLRDASATSKNSTVEAGFVPMYGGKCVLIRPSNDLRFLASDDKLHGVEKDNIDIYFPNESEADNALKKKVLEILKEQNGKDSLEHHKR